MEILWERTVSEKSQIVGENVGIFPLFSLYINLHSFFRILSQGYCVYCWDKVQKLQIINGKSIPKSQFPGEIYSFIVI